MTERKTVTVEISDDEILIAIKRPEGYEDVHPDLVAVDAMADVLDFEWYVIDVCKPAEPTQKELM